MQNKETLFKKTDSDSHRYNTIPTHAPRETLNGKTEKAWRGQLPPSSKYRRRKPKELDLLDDQSLIK
ncbi:hypothetical protein C7N83_01340 [Neisseria iguanae]|uniref:Uncharacterized protein n=1 Tax=Neisseria iguanae TaxID=90242 RepID=A0A2P7U2Z4_9NEIS|nr:hypothetical protein C7N83_01340 [Neisseria iguanae]